MVIDLREQRLKDEIDVLQEVIDRVPLETSDVENIQTYIDSLKERIDNLGK